MLGDTPKTLYHPCVGSCRPHALWATAPSVTHKKHTAYAAVKGLLFSQAKKVAKPPLTCIKAKCAMCQSPTGNAPEGLSCPQRGRRRKPEGEKAEGKGARGGHYDTPPLCSMFHTPYPNQKAGVEGVQPHKPRLVDCFAALVAAILPRKGAEKKRPISGVFLYSILSRSNSSFFALNRKTPHGRM